MFIFCHIPIGKYTMKLKQIILNYNQSNISWLPLQEAFYEIAALLDFCMYWGNARKTCTCSIKVH